MLALLNLPYAWAAVLAVAAAIEQNHFEKKLPLADKIEPGDSQEHVRAVLGEPQAQWDSPGFLSPGVPTWAYGTQIWAAEIIRADGALFPEPIPYKLRLFGPYEDDLVITWTKEGQVESVTPPKPQSGGLPPGP